MLLVEQNANMALKYATRAYVLESGTVALHGPAVEVAADPRVRQSYLGAGPWTRWADTWLMIGPQGAVTAFPAAATYRTPGDRY